MGKISWKQFEAILKQQLESNIEELRFSDEDTRLRLRTSHYFEHIILNARNYFVAIFFALNTALGHQINLPVMKTS